MAKGKAYYYFDTGKRVEGKKVYTPLPDLRDAKFGGSYAALMGHRSRGPSREVMRTPQLVDLYQKQKEFTKLAESSQKLYGLYQRRLGELLPTAPVAEITRVHMQRLVDNMAHQPGAANAFVRCSRALFAWAKTRGHVTENPAIDLSVPEMGEHDPWPETVVEAALRAEDPTVRLLTHMLLYTAQRINDVLKMTWSDLADGRVRLTVTKTKRQLDIPQHDNLKAELAGRSRDAFIVCTKDGKPITDQVARLTLQRFTRSLGCETVPHGLRKNAINALLEAGCSVAETASVSQQSLQMVEHYARKRNQSKLADAAILRWQNAT